MFISPHRRHSRNFHPDTSTAQKVSACRPSLFLCIWYMVELLRVYWNPDICHTKLTILVSTAVESESRRATKKRRWPWIPSVEFLQMKIQAGALLKVRRLHSWARINTPTQRRMQSFTGQILYLLASRQSPCRLLME